MRHLTPRKLFLIVYDLAMSLIALLLAVLVFYEGTVPVQIFNQIKTSWFVFVILAVVCFRLSGFYTQMWPFARGSQYLVLIAGTTIQLFLTVVTLQILKRSFPLAVYITYWFIQIGRAHV